MNPKKESKELSLKVPWGHVAGKAFGSPQNPPVLLVHGTLDNAGSFMRLIELLPDTFYYVSIDLPGHGLSSHFPSGLNLNFFDFVLTIKYVLDELHWDNCTYIGHSFGGQLGMIFSIVFPGRLEKLILFDAALPKVIDNKLLLPRIKYVNETTEFELNKKKSPLYTKDEVLDALMNRRQFTITKEAAQALFDRAVTKIGDKYQYNRDLRMKAYVYPNLNHDQYIELMKHHRVPTLIILSSESWFDLTQELSETLKFFKKIIPKTITFVKVEGNHDLHNNNPERAVSHVLSFLSNNSLKSKL